MMSVADIRLVGEGGYGCIIQPAVDGKYRKTFNIAYTDKDDTDIGKLFLEKRHFDAELKLLLGIQKIDTNSKFTVKLKGANSFQGNLLNSTIKRCLNTDDNSEIYQIVMEYGGKDIDSLSDKSIPFKHFIKYFRTFLEGLTLFHSFDMIHYDIKPANILVSHKKMSLIDFGISIPVDKMYSSDNLKRLSDFYVFHSPEAFMAYLLFNNKQSHSSFQNHLDTVVNEMEEYGFFNELWEDNKIESVKSQLQEFVDNIKHNNYSFEQVFNRNLAFKCDVYSLNFVIKEFAYKIIYDNDMQKEFVRELYSKCSAINPYKRATVAELLKYVKESETTLTQFNVSQPQIGGSKKRLRFPKLNKESSYNKRLTPSFKCKLPLIVNKHLKKQ